MILHSTLFGEEVECAESDRVEALGGYRIHVEFEDGTAGEIDLSDRLFGPVFEPLRDENEFRKVVVDEFGAVAWPCGADLRRTPLSTTDGRGFRLTGMGRELPIFCSRLEVSRLALSLGEQEHRVACLTSA